MIRPTGGVLLTGGAGLLAVNWAVTMRDQLPVTLGLHERRITVRRVACRQVNLESVDDLLRVCEEVQPSLVVHTAGMTNVDVCETKPDEARHVNVELATNVARACARLEIPLAHISTDHLFGGDGGLMTEEDPISPTNVYGRTKAEAESRVRYAYPEALVVRTNFYGWGPAYRRSFSDSVIDALRAGRTVTLFNDVYYSPILIEVLVHGVHDLVACKAAGVFHVASDDRLSKHEFGIKVAERFGLDPRLILGGSLDNHPGPAVRPHHMSLSNRKASETLGRSFGAIDDHLARLAQQERDGLAAELTGLGVRKSMIPYGRQHIDEDDIQAVVEVLRSGALTQGPAVEAFEQAIAAHVGAKYAVAVSSCTAGLHIAATAAGVGPGASLVTSPITFVASSNAALYNGGRALFADIDAATINISPNSLRETIGRNPDVRAIVPVHFAGLPCDMTAIKAIADDAGAVVIEDAAHALGARYADGRLVGSCAYSLMTVFSFHPVKTITTGEGGVITTNDERVYRRLLRLRSHGITKLDDPFEIPEQAETDGVRNPWYYELQELGFHFRITDLQCALGRSQLTKLDRFLARRRELVCRYDEALRGLPYCRPAQTAGRDRSGHHLYVVRIDFEALGTSRAEVMKALRGRQIITQVHYIPVPAQPLYRRLGHRPEEYPNAECYYREALSIPLYFDLNDEQQEYVVATLRDMLS